MSDADDAADEAAGGALHGGPSKRDALIEAYKLLDSRLSEPALSIEERTEGVCGVWGCIHSLCALSVSDTHGHLLDWAHRHTYTLLLQSEWQQPRCAALRDSLDAALRRLEAEAGAGEAGEEGEGEAWEAALVRKARSLRALAPDPWAPPVLRALLDANAEPPPDDAVLAWLTEERGGALLTRLQQLAASKSSAQLALNLVTAVMARIRSPTGGGEETCLGARLAAEAGFTADVLEQLADTELMLLFKLDRRDQFIELVKGSPLVVGRGAVERLCTRAATPPSAAPAAAAARRLWRSVADAATLAAQVMVARCLVLPRLADDAHKVLLSCASALSRRLTADPPRLRATFASLANLATTALHVHTLAYAVKRDCTPETSGFVCELYVRALTAGMNEMERLKLSAESAAEPRRQMAKSLAMWLMQLADLLVANPKVHRECVLTAFSVHPAPVLYERVANCPHVPDDASNGSEGAPPSEGATAEVAPPSEFGSWASDSRPAHTSFVKNSSTLALSASRDSGASAVSSAVLEGDGLGLAAELCQDLAVLLSGPRIKTLHWQMDRERLLANCRAHMERTAGGTRALSSALRYPNLDLSCLQHLPYCDENEDETDRFYGIEKGYEHLVEWEEEVGEAPAEAADATDSTDAYHTALADLYLSDSTGSASDDSDYRTHGPSHTRHRRRPRDLPLPRVDDAVDPLRLDHEQKPPKSRDRKKERHKKCKDKTPIKHSDRSKDVKCKPSDKGNRKEKAKKIKEPAQDSTPLSQLVGLQVQGVELMAATPAPKKDKRLPNSKKEAVSGSDYDSQTKTCGSSAANVTDKTQTAARTCPRPINQETKSKQEVNAAKGMLALQQSAPPTTSSGLPEFLSKPKLQPKVEPVNQSFNDTFANAVKISSATNESILESMDKFAQQTSCTLSKEENELTNQKKINSGPSKCIVDSKDPEKQSLVNLKISQPSEANVRQHLASLLQYRKKVRNSTHPVPSFFPPHLQIKVNQQNNISARSNATPNILATARIKDRPVTPDGRLPTKISPPPSNENLKKEIVMQKLLGSQNVNLNKPEVTSPINKSVALAQTLQSPMLKTTSKPSATTGQPPFNRPLEGLVIQYIPKTEPKITEQAGIKPPPKPRKSRKKVIEPNKPGSFVSMQPEPSQSNKSLLLNRSPLAETPSTVTNAVSSVVQNIAFSATPIMPNSNNSFQNFFNNLRATNNAGAVKPSIIYPTNLEPKTLHGYQNLQVQGKSSCSMDTVSKNSNVGENKSKVQKQKVCDKAPNTFARRNYMHKTKQKEVLMQKTLTTGSLAPADSVSAVSLHNLVLQSQGALSVFQKNPPRLQPNSTQACVIRYQPTKIPMQKQSTTVSSNPIISKILQTEQISPATALISRWDSSVSAPVSFPSSEADSNQPINLSPQKSKLTENDQKEIVNLLVQQSKLLQNSTIAKMKPVVNHQIVKQPSVIIPQTNNHHLVSNDNQELCKHIGISVIQTVAPSHLLSIGKQPDFTDLIELNKTPCTNELYPNMSAVQQEPGILQEYHPTSSNSSYQNQKTSQNKPAIKCYSSRNDKTYMAASNKKPQWESVLDDLLSHRTIRKIDDVTIDKHTENVTGIGKSTKNQDLDPKKSTETTYTKSDLRNLDQINERQISVLSNFATDQRSTFVVSSPNDSLVSPLEMKESLDCSLLDAEMDKDLIREIEEITSDEETRSVGPTRATTPLNQSTSKSEPCLAEKINNISNLEKVSHIPQNKLFDEKYIQNETQFKSAFPEGLQSYIAAANERLKSAEKQKEISTSNYGHVGCRTLENLQMTHNIKTNVSIPKTPTISSPATNISTSVKKNTSNLVGTKIFGMKNALPHKQLKVRNIRKHEKKADKIKILSNEIIHFPKTQTVSTIPIYPTKQPNTQPYKEYLSKPHIPDVLKNSSGMPAKGVILNASLQSKIMSLSQINISKVLKGQKSSSCDDLSQETNNVMERLNKEISEKISSKTSLKMSVLQEKKSLTDESTKQISNREIKDDLIDISLTGYIYPTESTDNTKPSTIEQIPKAKGSTFVKELEASTCNQKPSSIESNTGAKGIIETNTENTKHSTVESIHKTEVSTFVKSKPTASIDNTNLSTVKSNHKGEGSTFVKKELEVSTCNTKTLTIESHTGAMVSTVVTEKLVVNTENTKQSIVKSNPKAEVSTLVKLKATTSIDNSKLSSIVSNPDANVSVSVKHKQEAHNNNTNMSTVEFNPKAEIPSFVKENVEVSIDSTKPSTIQSNTNAIHSLFMENELEACSVSKDLVHAIGITENSSESNKKNLCRGQSKRSKILRVKEFKLDSNIRTIVINASKVESLQSNSLVTSTTRLRSSSKWANNENTDIEKPKVMCMVENKLNEKGKNNTIKGNVGVIVNKTEIGKDKNKMQKKKAVMQRDKPKNLEDEAIHYFDCVDKSVATDPGANKNLSNIETSRLLKVEEKPALQGFEKRHVKRKMAKKNLSTKQTQYLSRKRKTRIRTKKLEIPETDQDNKFEVNFKGGKALESNTSNKIPEGIDSVGSVDFEAFDFEEAIQHTSIPKIGIIQSLQISSKIVEHRIDQSNDADFKIIKEKGLEPNDEETKDKTAMTIQSQENVLDINLKSEIITKDFDKIAKVATQKISKPAKLGKVSQKIHTMTKSSLIVVPDDDEPEPVPEGKDILETSKAGETECFAKYKPITIDLDLRLSDEDEMKLPPLDDVLKSALDPKEPIHNFRSPTITATEQGRESKRKSHEENYLSTDFFSNNLETNNISQNVSNSVKSILIPNSNIQNRVEMEDSKSEKFENNKSSIQTINNMDLKKRRPKPVKKTLETVSQIEKPIEFIKKLPSISSSLDNQDKLMNSERLDLKNKDIELPATLNATKLKVSDHEIVEEERIVVNDLETTNIFKNVSNSVKSILIPNSNIQNTRVEIENSKSEKFENNKSSIQTINNMDLKQRRPKPVKKTLETVSRIEKQIELIKKLPSISSSLDNQDELMNSERLDLKSKVIELPATKLKVSDHEIVEDETKKILRIGADKKLNRVETRTKNEVEDMAMTDVINNANACKISQNEQKLTSVPLTASMKDTAQVIKCDDKSLVSGAISNENTGIIEPTNKIEKTTSKTNKDELELNETSVKVFPSPEINHSFHLVQGPHINVAKSDLKSIISTVAFTIADKKIKKPLEAKEEVITVGVGNGDVDTSQAKNISSQEININTLNEQEPLETGVPNTRKPPEINTLNSDEISHTFSQSVDSELDTSNSDEISHAFSSLSQSVDSELDTRTPEVTPAPNVSSNGTVNKGTSIEKKIPEISSINSKDPITVDTLKNVKDNAVVTEVIDITALDDDVTSLTQQNTSSGIRKSKSDKKKSNFKATLVSNNNSVDWQSFLSSEQFEKITANLENGKKYTIKINPLHGMNLSSAVVTEVKELHDFRRKPNMSKLVDKPQKNNNVIDVINLLSDDEDEDLDPIMRSGKKVCKIQSEFGSYYISPLERNTLKKHQDCLKKSCFVRLKNVKFEDIMGKNNLHWRLKNQQEKRIECNEIACDDVLIVDALQKTGEKKLVGRQTFKLPKLPKIAVIRTKTNSALCKSQEKKISENTVTLDSSIATIESNKTLSQTVVDGLNSSVKPIPKLIEQDKSTPVDEIQLSGELTSRNGGVTDSLMLVGNIMKPNFDEPTLITKEMDKNERNAKDKDSELIPEIKDDTVMDRTMKDLHNTSNAFLQPGLQLPSSGKPDYIQIESTCSTPVCLKAVENKSYSVQTKQSHTEIVENLISSQNIQECEKVSFIQSEENTDVKITSLEDSQNIELISFSNSEDNILKNEIAGLLEQMVVLIEGSQGISNECQESDALFRVNSAEMNQISMSMDYETKTERISHTEFGNDVQSQISTINLNSATHLKNVKTNVSEAIHMAGSGATSEHGKYIEPASTLLTHTSIENKNSFNLHLPKTDSLISDYKNNAEVSSFLSQDTNQMEPAKHYLILNKVEVMDSENTKGKQENVGIIKLNNQSEMHSKEIQEHKENDSIFLENIQQESGDYSVELNKVHINLVANSPKWDLLQNELKDVQSANENNVLIENHKEVNENSVTCNLAMQPKTSVIDFLHSQEKLLEENKETINEVYLEEKSNILLLDRTDIPKEIQGEQSVISSLYERSFTITHCQTMNDAKPQKAQAESLSSLTLIDNVNRKIDTILPCIETDLHTEININYSLNITATTDIHLNSTDMVENPNEQCLIDSEHMIDSVPSLVEFDTLTDDENSHKDTNVYNAHSTLEILSETEHNQDKSMNSNKKTTNELKTIGTDADKTCDNKIIRETECLDHLAPAIPNDQDNLNLLLLENAMVMKSNILIVEDDFKNTVNNIHGSKDCSLNMIHDKVEEDICGLNTDNLDCIQIRKTHSKVVEHDKSNNSKNITDDILSGGEKIYDNCEGNRSLPEYVSNHSKELVLEKLDQQLQSKQVEELICVQDNNDTRNADEMVCDSVYLRTDTISENIDIHVTEQTNLITGDSIQNRNNNIADVTQSQIDAANEEDLKVVYSSHLPIEAVSKDRHENIAVAFTTETSEKVAEKNDSITGVLIENRNNNIFDQTELLINAADEDRGLKVDQPRHSPTYGIPQDQNDNLFGSKHLKMDAIFEDSDIMAERINFVPKCEDNKVSGLIQVVAVTTEADKKKAEPTTLITGELIENSSNEFVCLSELSNDATDEDDAISKNQHENLSGAKHFNSDVVFEDSDIIKLQSKFDDECTDNKDGLILAIAATTETGNKVAQQTDLIAFELIENENKIIDPTELLINAHEEDRGVKADQPRHLPTDAITQDQYENMSGSTHLKMDAVFEDSDVMVECKKFVPKCADNKDSGSIQVVAATVTSDKKGAEQTILILGDLMANSNNKNDDVMELPYDATDEDRDLRVDQPILFPTDTISKDQHGNLFGHLNMDAGLEYSDVMAEHVNVQSNFAPKFTDNKDGGAVPAVLLTIETGKKVAEQTNLSMLDSIRNSNNNIDDLTELLSKDRDSKLDQPRNLPTDSIAKDQHANVSVSMHLKKDVMFEDSNVEGINVVAKCADNKVSGSIQAVTVTTETHIKVAEQTILIIGDLIKNSNNKIVDLTELPIDENGDRDLIVHLPKHLPTVAIAKDQHENVSKSIHLNMGAVFKHSDVLAECKNIQSNFVPECIDNCGSIQAVALTTDTGKQLAAGLHSNTTVEYKDHRNSTTISNTAEELYRKCIKIEQSCSDDSLKSICSSKTTNETTEIIVSEKQKEKSAMKCSVVQCLEIVSKESDQNINAMASEKTVIENLQIKKMNGKKSDLKDLKSQDSQNLLPQSEKASMMCKESKVLFPKLNENENAVKNIVEKSEDRLSSESKESCIVVEADFDRFYETFYDSDGAPLEKRSRLTNELEADNGIVMINSAACDDMSPNVSISSLKQYECNDKCQKSVHPELLEIAVYKNDKESSDINKDCKKNKDTQIDVSVKKDFLEDAIDFLDCSMVTSAAGRNNAPKEECIKEKERAKKIEPSNHAEIYNVDTCLNIPLKTYSIRKRTVSMKDVKTKPKKYREGKCINFPKQTKADMDATSYKDDLKRLQEYHSSLKFTDKQMFLRSHPEEMDLETLGPLTDLSVDNVNLPPDLEPCAINLFEDLKDGESETSIDHTSQLLNEENSEIELQKDLSQFPNDKKSDMGFGEGSDRVIVHLKNAILSKVSAATLSDVKPQPFLQSENCENDQNTQNTGYVPYEMECSYKSLRSRVRSYFENWFKKHNGELNQNTIKIFNDPEGRKIFKSVPGLYTTDFLIPAQLEQVVHVVQVGQLPVSAAAQNPVSCDPRESQASDASPSRCSDSSPQSVGADTSITKANEYTELTTAEVTRPQVIREVSNQDDVNHITVMQGGDYQELQNVTPEMFEKDDRLVESMQEEHEVEQNNLQESPRPINDAYPRRNDSPNNQYNHVTETQYNNNKLGVVTSETPVQFVFTTSQNNNVTESYQLSKQENGSVEKNDQIANAMTAAGIATTTSRAQTLVNILSQKIIRPPTNNQTINSSYQKTTSINAMAIQQALAQILPPPLNQTNSTENAPPTSGVGPPVLHIVQGKNPAGNQITLVENGQQSVLGSQGAQVLHIVQNKNTGAATTNGPQATSNYGGISLLDTGLQQGGNQLLHIVNAGANQNKNTNAAQLLKRVNLLTSLANVQGGNEQKMVQFLCKSADGKSIQLNAPHQRSMVLRLQPIETPPPNVQVTKADTQEPSPNVTVSLAASKDAPSQHEIKSRSIYEENYAKFIQSSGEKPLLAERTNTNINSLPKFNQAFGKTIYQDSNNAKQDEIGQNGSHLNINNGETTELAQENASNAINLDHMGQINSPPLLIRKAPMQTSVPQQNLVQQIKQTIAPMNIQTMHGGVIYTRQIPVNIGGGQTINLITVPSTELIDDSNHKQEVKYETEPQQIIKIIPQNQINLESGSDETDQSTPTSETSQTQAQPVLTQMRIKLPMLSKTPQVVPGARVVRPFFQIQRNVIAGTNQPVYQQLVLTTAPPLGQQTIRLPQPQQVRQIKVPAQTAESNLSTSTLEQLREFDMVLEQVKERSTVQPSPGSTQGPFSNLQNQSETQETMVTVATIPSDHTQQVLYSIGTSQALNVTYVNRKSVSTPTTTFVRSPDSTGIADSPTSTQMSHSVSDSSTDGQNKPRVHSKNSKTRPHKPSSTSPSSLKVAPVAAKTSVQKPLEDEQTTQRILYILAEYKEQVENSPDKDKPAPRRRSNPPTNPTGSSKRKKSSGGSSRRPGRDLSPAGSVDDLSRTMGSEDSSCGTSQGDCTESCGLDAQSPQGSPRKVPRKLTFEQEVAPAPIQQRLQRNVIVADGQTIAVARSPGGKPATAVLMPANYLVPVSMMKGGQQIAIVTNRGPKILTMPHGEGGAANTLLLQRLIGPTGLKPMLARPGVRHVRLPTTALHNLHAFNLTTTTTVPTPQSNVSSPAPSIAPNDQTDTPDASPWPEDGASETKAEESCSGSEAGEGNWRLTASGDNTDYTYEEPSSATPRHEPTERTVLGPMHDRYSPDMDAHRIFDKMFIVDSKKCDSPRVAQGYDMDASQSDCDEKQFNQVVHKNELKASHGGTLRNVTHVSATALRHKYAILEHELRLQKSLSEECEDLGVDSPSASELFPEAELLFAASPAHEHSQEHSAHHHHSHHPPPSNGQLSGQAGAGGGAGGGVPQPDLHDQAARAAPDAGGAGGAGAAAEAGELEVARAAAGPLHLDQEEFARAHPNTTFHSEPTDEEVQPFTMAAMKARHIAFHAHGGAPTVLVAAPACGVIARAAPEPGASGRRYSGGGGEAEESSRDADDDRSSPEPGPAAPWGSSPERRPSSDSDESGGRVRTVIRPRVRITYPAKRAAAAAAAGGGAGAPEGRRRASARGAAKRGCPCCPGSPPRTKKPRNKPDYSPPD